LDFFPSTLSFCFFPSPLFFGFSFSYFIASVAILSFFVPSVLSRSHLLF
jgi:hypothetical protein